MTNELDEIQFTPGWGNTLMVLRKTRNQFGTAHAEITLSTESFLVDYNNGKASVALSHELYADHLRDLAGEALKLADELEAEIRRRAKEDADRVALEEAEARIAKQAKKEPKAAKKAAKKTEKKSDKKKTKKKEKR
jgi:hypothetical protein